MMNQTTHNSGDARRRTRADRTNGPFVLHFFRAFSWDLHSFEWRACWALSVSRPSLAAMRVLHTSDWHVGRMFHGRDLLADQESVLSGLADLVADERVDVVVVSGDLYDRAVPSGEAVSVCTRVLDRIRQAGARLVITPGNHDSAPRLGAFAEFAAAGGLHLRTRVAELDRPVVLDDAHGPVAL